MCSRRTVSLPAEIGQGARHAQHAVIAARRKPEPLGRLGQQLAAVGVGRRDLVEQLAVGLGVGADALGSRSARRWSSRARARRAPPPRRALARRRQRQVGGRHRRHVDMQVDAVEQRPGDARLVVLGAFGRAPAGQRGIVEIAAAARIHRRDELHARRIGAHAR